MIIRAMWNPTSATATVRGASFVLWALAAGSAAFWALKLGGPSGVVDLPLAPARTVAAADPAAIARLLGSTPAAGVTGTAPPSLASRFRLLGVAAARSGAGAAILSVDGKPGRPYRVGSLVEEGLILQSVQARSATLAADAHGPALVILELPELAK